MGIKSVLWGSENLPAKPYPKLMVNDYGLVVLFKNKSNGCIVSAGTVSNNTYRIGLDVTLCNEDAFKDYIGSVTLENT